MAFVVTDREVQGRSSTTWVMHELCGVTEIVHDRPYDEQAIESAERAHGACYACVDCGDHIGPDEISAFAHRECHFTDSINQMGTDDFLARMRDSARRRARYTAETDRILENVGRGEQS